MAPDESKLKPFFRGPQNLVNNVGANSQEVRKLIYRSIKYECLSDYNKEIFSIKFSFSKKATKIETIFYLIWRQMKWKIVANFCGFSECLNFMRSIQIFFNFRPSSFVLNNMYSHNYSQVIQNYHRKRSIDYLRQWSKKKMSINSRTLMLIDEFELQPKRDKINWISFYMSA